MRIRKRFGIRRWLQLSRVSRITSVSFSSKANGTSQITEPHTGIKIESHPDGSFSQFNPDGRVVKGYPDGSQTILNPDSSVIRRKQDGSVAVRFANGTEAIRRRGKKRRQKPRDSSYSFKPSPLLFALNKIPTVSSIQSRIGSDDLETTTPRSVPEKIGDSTLTDLIDSTVLTPGDCTLFVPDKAGLVELMKKSQLLKKFVSDSKYKSCFYMQHLVPNVRINLHNTTSINKLEIVSV